MLTWFVDEVVFFFSRSFFSFLGCCFLVVLLGFFFTAFELIIPSSVASLIFLFVLVFLEWVC